MAEIIISSYFENASGPAIGLTPSIRIWEVTTTGENLVVGAPCGTGQATDGVMSELGDCGSPETQQDGFYRYTFTSALGFDSTKSYVVRVDGGGALPNRFRYQASKIACVDSIEGVADAVWNAEADNYALGSPVTMGGLQNATYVSVETIRVTDIPALFALMDIVRKYHTNRTKIDASTYTLTVYDDDCVTPIRIFRLLDSSGTPSVTEVCERTSIDGTLVGSPETIIGDDGYPACSTDAP